MYFKKLNGDGDNFTAILPNIVATGDVCRGRVSRYGTSCIGVFYRAPL